MKFALRVSAAPSLLWQQKERRLLATGCTPAAPSVFLLSTLPEVRNLRESVRATQVERPPSTVPGVPGDKEMQSRLSCLDQGLLNRPSCVLMAYPELALHVTGVGATIVWRARCAEINS